MADIKAEVSALTSRIDVAEDRISTAEAAVRSQGSSLTSQGYLLVELQRRVEDLDNQGHRHNIRLRRVPETVLPGQLDVVVLSIFNGLLEGPPDSPISLERFHRTLRPRGGPVDPPRDLISCLVDFQVKEEIMRGARYREPVQFGEVTVQLFQDLSPVTLQQRRALIPLQDLRDGEIIYRWRFPFLCAVCHSHRPHCCALRPIRFTLIWQHPANPLGGDTRMKPWGYSNLYPDDQGACNRTGPLHSGPCRRQSRRRRASRGSAQGE